MIEEVKKVGYNVSKEAMQKLLALLETKPGQLALYGLGGSLEIAKKLLGTGSEDAFSKLYL